MLKELIINIIMLFMEDLEMVKKVEKKILIKILFIFF